MGSRVLHLRGGSIFSNLAIEEYFFRHLPCERLLLLYSNSSAVVLGRNQNPWKECNIARMTADRTSLARRNSGGGTVFHDPGNLNFSFISPAAVFSKHTTTAILASALTDGLGIPARANDRFDVLLHGKKISGAAFRIAGKNAYHHGTMLVHSDLDRLQDSITSPNLAAIKSKGTESVRSKVCNLRELYPELTVDSVASAVAQAFLKHDGGSENISPNSAPSGGDVPPKIEQLNCDEFIASNDWTRKELTRIKSVDWVFGETPPFSLPLGRTFPWGDVRLEFHAAKGGVIQKVDVELPARFPRGLAAKIADALAQAGAVCERKSVVAVLAAQRRAVGSHFEELYDIEDWLDGALFDRTVG